MSLQFPCDEYLVENAVQEDKLPAETVQTDEPFREDAGTDNSDQLRSKVTLLGKHLQGCKGIRYDVRHLFHEPPAYEIEPYEGGYSVRPPLHRLPVRKAELQEGLDCNQCCPVRGRYGSCSTLSHYQYPCRR